MKLMMVRNPVCCCTGWSLYPVWTEAVQPCQEWHAPQVTIGWKIEGDASAVKTGAVTEVQKHGEDRPGEYCRVEGQGKGCRRGRGRGGRGRGAGREEASYRQRPGREAAGQLLLLPGSVLVHRGLPPVNHVTYTSVLLSRDFRSLKRRQRT